MATVVVSESSGNWIGTNSDFVDVPNLQVTIATTGGPVLLTLRATSDNVPSGDVGTGNQGAGVTFGHFRFRRGADNLPVMTLGSSGSTGSKATLSIPCSAISYIDVPPKGNITYVFQARASKPAIAGGPHTVSVTQASLVAMAL